MCDRLPIHIPGHCPEPQPEPFTADDLGDLVDPSIWPRLLERLKSGTPVPDEPFTNDDMEPFI